MSYPIAMIPYANMAPFWELGPPPGCHLVDCTPRRSISALKAKEIWAAAVPVGGLAHLAGEVDFLGSFGIAARSEVMSVLFFSDRPFETFCRPLTLHLSSESASSIRLLYLLLGYEHGFDRLPYAVDENQRANGALLIGDTALQAAQALQGHGAVDGFQIITDLAARWDAYHRLPFVFARWVIRSDAPGQLRAALLDWLGTYREQEGGLIRQAAPKVAARLGLSLDYAERYLKVIRRCLTAEDEAGQERFLSELRRHAREPLFAAGA
jgi:chorismate dehydratase